MNDCRSQIKLIKDQEISRSITKNGRWVMECSSHEIKCPLVGILHT